MKRTQHILVSGRVQGVSFRYFTKVSAEQLGVKGWVRNLHDGRVEAVAQGLVEQLEELRKLIMRGPVKAQVNQVEVREVQVISEFTSFEIRENGEEPCPVKK